MLIGWTDTRDQYADGLTKGSVSRELLQEVAGGSCGSQHQIKWISDVKSVKNLSSPVEDPLA